MDTVFDIVIHPLYFAAALVTLVLLGRYAAEIIMDIGVDDLFSVLFIVFLVVIVAVMALFWWITAPVFLAKVIRDDRRDRQRTHGYL